MAITLRQVNQAIASLGYELVRGRDYFYFWPLNNSVVLLKNSNINVPRLSNLTIEQWVESLKQKIADMEHHS